MGLQLSNPDRLTLRRGAALARWLVQRGRASVVTVGFMSMAQVRAAHRPSRWGNQSSEQFRGGTLPARSGGSVRARSQMDHLTGQAASMKSFVWRQKAPTQRRLHRSRAISRGATGCKTACPLATFTKPAHRGCNEVLGWRRGRDQSGK